MSYEVAYEEFRVELSTALVIAVVRAPSIPDPGALCTALAAGGIPWAELTYSTPNVGKALRAATADGHWVGAGTVLTAAQATEAIEAGVKFLVTPGVRPEVAAVAHDAGVPVVLGALTPTEVAAALDLGPAAVKIFPARAFGPGYFKDLGGPYPGVPLVASGGVNADNAADFLAQGALAVCAGTEVVPPDAVAAGDWAEITHRAQAFMAALRSAK